MTLLYSGAEADIYLLALNDDQIILKKRPEKEYRLKQIDIRLRKHRTSHEVALLHQAKTLGVRTPIVYFVDKANFAIAMEYVHGTSVKEYLGHLGKREKIALCEEMGKMAGNLHDGGIVHGDLTTSNFIANTEKTLYLIDFGLAYRSDSLEDHGVDLYLLNRTLSSYHHEFARQGRESVLQGYSAERSLQQTKKITAKMQEIERRGRYFQQHSLSGK
ncbi:MAG: KEOPS complex kinase/ATPase Bud32 [Candidatus Bathyarchaeia archaeon]